MEYSANYNNIGKRVDTTISINLVVMDKTTRFWIYVSIALVVIVGVMLVWRLFMDEIIWNLGWLLVFALLFGAGWLTGRYIGRRNPPDDKATE